LTISISIKNFIYRKLSVKSGANKMSKISQIPNSELFRELSVQEQESVSGGFIFILQKTDVTTFAINELSVTNSSGNSIHSRQQTGYTQSEVILGFAGFPFLGKESNGQQSKGNLNLSNLLSRLLFSLF
jgi:hypothetical protein